MTSLEGVSLVAVRGADLRVGVSGSSRGLPLVTPANGMVTLVGPPVSCWPPLLCQGAEPRH